MNARGDMMTYFAVQIDKISTFLIKKGQKNK